MKFPYFPEFLNLVQAHLVDYIDIDFTLWMSWVLMPLLLTFILPFIIFALVYLTLTILYIYRLHSRRILVAYGTDFWEGARKLVSAMWDAHGWLWHGYEIRGMENIPEDRPVLFIYYHGAIPVDLYYFISRFYLLKNKLVHTVADKFLFKLPGWDVVSEGLKVIPGTIQTCTDLLIQGNLLAISPGGVYEAQFGDSNYRLMWKKRVGFAKVALGAGVDIVPMFTQNIREAFRVVTIGRKLWMRLYLWTRLPIVPIYGGFPVKLITHVGKPISCLGEDMTPDKLQRIAAKAIDDLITKHQRTPGSILRGLTERIYMFPKDKEN